MENSKPTDAQIRDLSDRLRDLEKGAQRAALWELIADEVGTELDRRLLAQVEVHGQNSIRAILQAEENSEAARSITYRMALIVNGKQCEAVLTLPMAAVVMGSRYEVLDKLKASLAEQVGRAVMAEAEMSFHKVGE